MSPRIALDLRWIRPGRVDGVGRYVASLARALVQLDGDERYLLVFTDAIARDAFLEHSRELGSSQASPCGIPLLGAADALRFPRWLRERGIDLLHVPHALTSPLHRGYTTVVTLHDLIPWQARGREPGARLVWRAYFATWWPLRFTLRRVSRVIAVSSATRDALRALPWMRVPVHVVANGVELGLSEMGAPSGSDPITRNGPAGPILYVGRLDPYKNVVAWLREYATLPARLTRKHPLVLCGHHDARFAEPLARLVRELGLRDTVEFRGAVSDAELDRLYRTAALLVHPSLEEGFGLTVLEAMARGTPVVAYRIPALAEIAGDGARLVDPHEPGALAAAALELLDSPADWTDLAARGSARAERFSWQRAALETRDVYRAALAARAAGALS